jgi:hypothetical protein
MKKILTFIILVVFGGEGFCQGINIKTNAYFRVTGAATINIVNGGLIDNGTYTKDIEGDETVTFSGTETAGRISGSSTTIVNNLTLTNTKGITIAAGKKLTVSGTLTNSVVGYGGLVIESTSDAANGTASLLNSTTEVRATVERWMSGDLWHLISPAATRGESIDDFVGTTQNDNLIARKAANNNYALAPYNEGTDLWDYYKIDNTDLNSSTFDKPGKGYQVLRASAADGKTGTGNGTEGGTGKVDFKGTLGAADVLDIPITKSKYGWNLVGNPYPCAMNVTAFIAANTGAIDVAYRAIYVSKMSDITVYGYQPHTATPAITNLAPGEGFFVKSVAGGGTIDFTTTMKSHTSDAFKSAVIQNGFNLVAESGGDKMSTTVKYIPQMTAGLDPGWDLGLFYNGEDSPLSLYTWLVEEYGVDFTIQCLPDYDYENLIVPVGIKAKQGATIEFSLADVTVPVGYKVFLEDKVSRKFTRLDEQGSSYSVQLNASSNGTGRFFLHTKQEITGMKDGLSNQFVVIPMPQHNIIRISGLMNLPAQATVYDMNGRMIAIKKLTSLNENEIPLQGVSKGFYLIKIKSDKQTTQSKFSWTL